MRLSSLPLVMRGIVLVAVMAWPVVASGQEVVNGTVKDASSAVVPGVTITATHEATGNTFVGVTDAVGAYAVRVRPGSFRVTAELAGFTTVSRTGVELLVGQAVTLNFEMKVSAVAETLTVTGEAPLLDVTQSSVGGNIDPRQMSELPVQGRDWMALTLVAPGSRATNIGGVPVEQSREDNTEFELNLDGQQVTTNLGFGNQPRFSRDSIAEFEFIANRFDATQGRSPGVQVNAVTKSGTNAFTGLGGAYFRDSDWNAKDHVLNRSVPFVNQQFSGAVGGPIKRDRIHFFANAEYERSPRTSIAQTAFPAFNVELEGTNTVKLAGGRVDYQYSPNTRLMVRGDLVRAWIPFADLSSDHPASSSSTDEKSYNILGSLTQVLGTRAVNEVRVGFNKWGYFQNCLVKWTNHWQAENGITTCVPRIRLAGFRIWPNTHHPREGRQRVPSVRDDLSFSFAAKGRHDVKVGGEWLGVNQYNTNCTACAGVIDARGGPVPANITQIFPDPFNADTWRLDLLGPIVRTYELGVGDFFAPVDMPKIAAWTQDDWKIASNLTLNLGLRYDLIWNAFGQQWSAEPWLKPNRPQDANNIQPRLGFAWSLNDSTVIRGGGGLYYADVVSSNGSWALRATQVATISVRNDLRPNFVTDPFNGRPPTFEQAQSLFCYANNRPGCLLRNFEDIPTPDAKIAQRLQTSIGMQRQLGSQMSFEADYVYARGRNEKTIISNGNLTYDPTTGANYPWSNASRRYNPSYGIVGLATQDGRSTYHALQTAFRKRFSDNWQAGITYTLSGYWTGDPRAYSGLEPVSFPVASDLGNDYSLANTDQRHRAVLNGIWEVGRGFQLSGTYFYGSGRRYTTQYGADLRDVGQTSEALGERLRADGSILPRANLIGEPIHRMDVRLQQRIPLVGRFKVDGLLEVFNVFDRANYGSYVYEELNPQYGHPLYSSNLAYAPRTLQLGVRATF